ncbi:hypothetical protein JHK85_027851 [Glycine max]|nr:hypothetical protein JHK85_027851 [Glycine max]
MILQNYHMPRAVYPIPSPFSATLLLRLRMRFINTITSALVLWVMRELPLEEAASISEESSTIAFVADSSIAIHHPQRWTTSTSM